ncbi:GldL-related protein [Lacinutrix chionoecetis]
MKNKQFIIPVIIFLLGFIFTILGALFKIQHWPYGPQLLTIGSFIEVIGLIVLIGVLVKSYFKK